MAGGGARRPRPPRRRRIRTGARPGRRGSRGASRASPLGTPACDRAGDDLGRCRGRASRRPFLRSPRTADRPGAAGTSTRARSPSGGLRQRSSKGWKPRGRSWIRACGGGPRPTSTQGSSAQCRTLRASGRGAIAARSSGTWPSTTSTTAARSHSAWVCTESLPSKSDARPPDALHLAGLVCGRRGRSPPSRPAPPKKSGAAARTRTGGPAP